MAISVAPGQTNTTWDSAVVWTRSQECGSSAECNAKELLHGADNPRILILDETSFPKKGSKSVGVHRRYNGAAGQIENCQIDVFLTLSGAKGYTLIDRELYLSKPWIGDVDRLPEAHVPKEVKLATKLQLAL